jgi:hypothetical protein
MLHGKVLAIILVLPLFAASCRASIPAGSDEGSMVSTAVVSTSVKASPTGITPYPLTPLITPPPSRQPTTTLVPTRTATATFAPRPTATASLTPLPTLSAGEAETLVLDLLQNSAECRLPCWWGFVPGETSWGEAQNVLATIASEIARTGPSDRPLYTVYIPVPSELHPSTRLIYEYRVNNDVIEMIEVMFALDYYGAYLLPQILNMYGPPEEIWVRTFDRSRDLTLPFYLVLFYPQHGFMIRYYDDAELEAGSIRACFHQEERPLLWVWSPLQLMTFTEAAASSVNFGLDEEEQYRPLEEVTPIDVETFFARFSQPENSDCLYTPASLWPPP